MTERHLTPDEIRDAAEGDLGEREEGRFLLPHDDAPSHALRRSLLHALSGEQRRRRRGGTPADATALTAAEAKRARKRERNRDRLG